MVPSSITGSAALVSEGGGIGVGRVVVVVVVVVVEVVVVVDVVDVVVIVGVAVVVVAATVVVVDGAVTALSSSLKKATEITVTMSVTTPTVSAKRRDIAFSLPSMQVIPLPRGCHLQCMQEFRCLDMTNRRVAGDGVAGHRLQQLVRRDVVGIG